MSSDAGKPAGTDSQDRPRERQWTGSLPQIAGEDMIDIEGGRHAHFRRDRRFAQVQVVFTASAGVDPNPGRELTDQFKEQGWTWWPNKPGKPWIHQLDEPSEYDPTARGDSHDVLHEQFLIIIEEYRQNHGMPPLLGWPSFAAPHTKAPDADLDQPASGPVDDQAASIREKQTPQSTEEEARAGGPAAGMLAAFASVGAERFDLTLTNAGGNKVGYQSNRTQGQLRSAMPAILQNAEEQQHNVIVRPRSAGTMLVQLDDLGETAEARLRPVSFLVLCTSPRNYQAWVAVANADEDFARRLKKGAGADLTASGATRVSGSLNFKEKYAPAFPRVETVHASPGRVVSRAELDALGVVVPEEKTPAVIHSHSSGAKGWPSYSQCLKHPNAQKDGRPDRSKADYTFCLLAIDWGWSVEETAGRLMEESGKAQENGEAYALRTARAAARAVEGRGKRSR